MFDLLSLAMHNRLNELAASPAVTVPAASDDLTRTDIHQAVFRAIADNDMAALHTLLNHPTLDILVHNEDLRNPLHFAILAGNDEAAFALIHQCADDPRIINAVDRNGYTPLMIASEKNNIPLMRRLIEMRAAVDDSHDIYCTPAVCSAKSAAINKAEIFREAECDVFSALLIAARNGDRAAAQAFVDAGADPTGALCSGSVFAATAVGVLRGVGAEPTLAMVQWAVGSLESAPDRAKGLRALSSPEGRTSVALISAAFAYAIITNQVVAARTLLLLGADGDTALSNAVDARDAAAMKMLLVAGVNPSRYLETLAEQGDVNAVKFLREARVDAAAALRSLARQGKSQAIAVLIQAGVDPKLVMKELVLKRDEIGVAALIRAGVSSADLLREFARAPDLRALRFMIEAGAEASDTLIQAAKAGERLTQAILIEAGVNILSAINRAGKRDQALLESQLAGAYSDVLELRSELGRAVSDLLVERLLVVRDHARSSKQIPDSALLAGALQAAKEGTFGVVALVRTLDSGDWPVMKLLLAESDEQIGAKVLMLALKHHDLNAAIFLMAAGIDYMDAYRDAVKRQDAEAIRLLVDAGVMTNRVLVPLLIESKTDLAKQFLQKNMDHFEIVKQLVESSKMMELKLLIPRVIDGSDVLMQAGRGADVALVNTLLSVGADGPAALAKAIAVADVALVNVLIDCGVDKAAALAHAIATGQKGAAQNLIMLGADVSEAYLHASYRHDTVTEQGLLALGADPAKALACAAQRGMRVAVAALLSSGVDGFEVLREAIDRDDLETAEILLACGLIADDTAAQAARYGDMKTLKWLMTQNANVSAVMTALAKQSDVEAVTLMAEAGVNPTEVLEGIMREPINVDAMKTLIKAGASTMTLLAEAVSTQNIAVIKALIESGANPAFEFMEAFTMQDVKTAGMLIKLGANPGAFMQMAGRRRAAARAFIVSAQQEATAETQHLATNGDMSA